MSMDDLRSLDAAKDACVEAEKMLKSVMGLGYSENIAKGMLEMKYGEKIWEKE